MALAAKRESRFWLVAAGALLGLAMQANPVSALVLPGVISGFWFNASRRIGLRTPWPYLAVVAFVAAYAPVIVYNAQNELFGALTAQNRQTYVWQPDPSLRHYIRNLWRLTLQLVVNWVACWKAMRPSGPRRACHSCSAHGACLA